MKRLKIAVVGAGISGLGAAWLLSRRHDVVLFEAERRLGGHARTVITPTPRGPVPVDTGFIVFNYANYPHLAGLFAELNVPVKKSDMTFAVTVDDGAVEYGCKSVATMLAQRSNTLRPAFWRMVRDILAFNRSALAVAESDPSLTLGGLIDRQRLGEWFALYYMLPIAGAIWSTPRERIRDFPALALARFFANHGLLSVNGHHQWWTVDGGAREYVERMRHTMTADVREGATVESVRRGPDGPLVRAAGQEAERFDHVVFACHSDQALALLADPEPAERRVLERIRYSPNRAVLHDDPRQMPKRRSCWSSWVYRARSNEVEKDASVTYWMNNLQGIPEDAPLFVTLNPADEIPDERIIDEHICHHPRYDLDAIAAQAELPAVQGRRGIWYCGAWTRNGFHEDGLASAVTIAERLGAPTPWKA